MCIVHKNIWYIIIPLATYFIVIILWINWDNICKWLGIVNEEILELYDDTSYIEQNPNVQYSNKFYKVLFSMLRNDSLTSLEDIENIYQGIFKDYSDRKHLKSLIQSALAMLFLDDEKKKGLDEQEHSTTYFPYADAEQVKQWHCTLKMLIRDIDKESPYSDLPAQERTLLLDIERYIELGEPKSGKERITELAAIIRTGHADMNILKESLDKMVLNML
jgi:hypothetical protein